MNTLGDINRDLNLQPPSQGDTRKGKTKVKSAPKGRAKSAAKPKTKESKKQPAGQSKDKTTKTRSVTPYGEAKKAFTAK